MQRICNTFSVSTALERKYDVAFCSDVIRATVTGEPLAGGFYKIDDYPVVLVGCHRGEAGLGEDEGPVRHGPGGSALSLPGKIHHVQPRLVAVHRVEDYLFHNKKIALKSYNKKQK